MSWASVARGERRTAPSPPTAAASSPATSRLLAGAPPAAWPLVGQTAEEAARAAAANPRPRPTPASFAWGHADRVPAPAPHSVPLVLPPPLDNVADGVAAEAMPANDDARAEDLRRTYSAQCYYVRAFQERPAAFLQQFMTSLPFQQSVLAAGLTFDATADPARPVLLNMYHHLLGNAHAFPAPPGSAPPPRAPPRMWREGGAPPHSAPPHAASPPSAHVHRPHQHHHRRSHGGGRPRHGGERVNGDHHGHHVNFVHQGNHHHGPPQQQQQLSVPRAGPGRVTRRSNEPLPVMPTVPVVDMRTVKAVHLDCTALLKRIVPPDEEGHRRSRLLGHMNKVVRNEWTGACVRIFGSAGNGLSLVNGDVDMCLFVPKSGAKRVIRGKTRPQNEYQIMRRMADLLRRNKMENVQDLLRARVPILKMFDPVSRFNIDICINNELVGHNTDLISAYIALDSRVKSLCLLVKYWAKRREVNETYRGTLSSYAYVLLVINFLQTRPHPVVPCLQRMVNGKEVQPGEALPTQVITNSEKQGDKPNERPVEYNVYFDRSRPNYVSKNKTSVGGLLLEFFRYYAFEFDFENLVVSVRDGRVLRREEKNWDVISVQREAEAAEREFLVEQEIAEREAIAAQEEMARKEAIAREEQVAQTVKLVKDMERQSHAQSQSPPQQQANGAGTGVFVEQDGKLVRGHSTSRFFPEVMASAEAVAHASPYVSKTSELASPVPVTAVDAPAHAAASHVSSVAVQSSQNDQNAQMNRTRNSQRSEINIDASALAEGVSKMTLSEFATTNGDTGNPANDVPTSVASSKSSIAGSVASDVLSPGSILGPQSPGLTNSPAPSPRGPKPPQPNNSGHRGRGPSGPPRPRLHKPRFVERHMFCIEDPFNLSHDLSRIVDEETLLVIQQELVRAYELLSTNGNLTEVFRPFTPQDSATASVHSPRGVSQATGGTTMQSSRGLGASRRANPLQPPGL